MNGSKHYTEAVGFVRGPLSVVSCWEEVRAAFPATDKGQRTADEAVGERTRSDTSRTVRSGGGAWW